MALTCDDAVKCHQPSKLAMPVRSRSPAPRGVIVGPFRATPAAPNSIATAASAQQFGPSPDPATEREILALREGAWRAWFTNDRAAFQRIVPDELVALGWDGGPWDDQARTLANMAQFAEGGSTLTALEFPRNVLQRYGDVVILYTSFRLVLTDRAGRARETSGRGTEIFVRREGRWIHTGWHLDAVADQGEPYSRAALPSR